MKKLKRKYKEVDVDITLKNIKNLLKKAGIKTKIIFNHNIMPGIYSCRVEVDGNLGDFGACGKGMTESYSLASGYAELLERIQNDFYANFPRLFLNSLKKEFGFFYYPDEKIIKYKEFKELPLEIIEDILGLKTETIDLFLKSYFKRAEYHGNNGIIGVPFFDTKNKKTVLLPENLLKISTGTNGMAAGNSLIEASYQALCEIMERYCASIIFYNKITPPTIPDSYLKQFKDEYSIIKNIEKGGKYEVIVKCFSANLNFPTLGLIIINKEKNMYRLNVGTDTDFKVALGRCLTEIYQGTKDENWFDGLLLDMEDTKEEYFFKNTPENINKRRVTLLEFTKNGQGAFPCSLFSDESDYDFDSKVFQPLPSYELEVKKIISMFHDLNHNVYFRDVSYAGFPSVYIYIPKVSTSGHNNSENNQNNDSFFVCELDKAQSLFFKLKECNNEELKQIIKVVNFSDNKMKALDLFQITVKEESIMNSFSAPFLATLIWIKLRRYGEALRTFKSFWDPRKDKKENDYYRIVYNLLEGRANKLSDGAIKQKLNNFNINSNTVKEVFNDFEDEDLIFENINLPSCPNCISCTMLEDCLTSGRYNLSRILYKVKNNQTIKQSEWSTLLLDKD